MKVGDRIKELRKNKDMSQVELADSVGVSKQTMYKYENNIITNIPSDVIERIAKILNVSEAYLMGWEQEPEQIPYMREYTNLHTAVKLFESLDDIGQDMAIESMKLIQKVHPRKEEPILSAAHERTDIEVTEEMKKHDDDIMDDDDF